MRAPNVGLSVGSSPLTRGKHTRKSALNTLCGLIPAHAGKTYPRMRPCARCGAHPRSRGENLPGRTGDDPGAGSSPLTRGKPRTRPSTYRSSGLIPAHAGKTTPCSEGHTLTWAHPRSRGENLVSRQGHALAQGSSPLTRGKPDHEALGPALGGLIPAHAGKTETFTDAASAQRAHPRSRGENHTWA